MIDQIFASQGKRVLDRLMPEGSMRAEPTLLYNLKVIFDEGIMDLIAADDDGSALREAGFSSIADAIDHRIGGLGLAAEPAA